MDKIFTDSWTRNHDAFQTAAVQSGGGFINSAQPPEGYNWPSTPPIFHLFPRLGEGAISCAVIIQRYLHRRESSQPPEQSESNHPEKCTAPRVN